MITPSPDVKPVPKTNAERQRAFRARAKARKAAHQPALRSGPKPFWTVDKIEPALRVSHGVISLAALRLSNEHRRACRRQTISAKVSADPYLQEVVADAQATLADLVMYRLIQRALLEDDFNAQLTLLRRFGADRGYGR